jgi:23S rRNA (guanosine2251-2'-O)-methyltransferase
METGLFSFLFVSLPQIIRVMSESNQNAIFGIRPVIEAINAGKQLDKVMVKNGLEGELIQELKDLLKRNRIFVQYVPEEKLNSVTRQNHQGVIAFAAQIEYYELEVVVTAALEKEKAPLFLILDGVTDVRNFGAIARTAECAGVDAIIIPAKGSAQINSDAIKASAGALHFIPVVKVSSLRTAIFYLRDSGIQIVASSEKARHMMYKVDMTPPTAIIMGSEDKGISSDNLKFVDEMVKVPLSGQIESLNVGVAAALVVFEAVRQRIYEHLEEI